MTVTRRNVMWALVSGATVARAFALETNELLPHFAARTLDGERISSESVKGKVVLIDFGPLGALPARATRLLSRDSARSSKKTVLLFSPSIWASRAAK
jgi:hypothetical protein